MIYFTSDTHYSHSNIIKFCNRPFKDVIEMNQCLVDNWNSVVTPKDIVYHLGDFSFGDSKTTDHIIKSLKGHITLILGNHDYKRVKGYTASLFDEVCHLKQIKVDSETIVMCHYPMLVWNKSHYGSIMLHGHQHGSGRYIPGIKRLDVGVDVHNFSPISIERVLEIFNDGNYEYPKNVSYNE
jgi:calcineurin-like phosphoesterase family protein